MSTSKESKESKKQSKSKEESETMSSLSRSGEGIIQRSVAFDAKDWREFEALNAALGLSPQSFIRKVVRDFVEGNYVNLDSLRTDARAELTKYANELRASRLQPVLDQILFHWFESRKGKR